MCLVGAGAILSVGLLRSIEWAKMEKRFDVDGGVSGGIVPQQITIPLQNIFMVITVIHVSCVGWPKLVSLLLFFLVCIGDKPTACFEEEMLFCCCRGTALVVTGLLHR